MSKRLILFFLTICLFLSLCACSGETSEIVTLEGVKNTAAEKTSLYSASVFTTRNDQEYLQFLTNFDYQNYKIVDISTGMYTYHYGESYLITYREPV